MSQDLFCTACHLYETLCYVKFDPQCGKCSSQPPPAIVFQIGLLQRASEKTIHAS